MEIIEDKENTLPLGHNSQDRLKGEGQKQQNANLQKRHKEQAMARKKSEIGKLNYLASRSKKSFKRDLKMRVDQLEGTSLFEGVFSAFKSAKDYFIAEYGQGYAIFVDGKLKKAERDQSKINLNLFP